MQDIKGDMGGKVHTHTRDNKYVDGSQPHIQWVAKVSFKIKAEVVKVKASKVLQPVQPKSIITYGIRNFS